MRCNKATEKLLDEKIAQFSDMVAMISEIKDGASVTETLSKYNYSYKLFNKLLNTQFLNNKGEKKKEISLIDGKNCCLTPSERLWCAIMGTERIEDVPSDVDKTMESLIKTVLTKREIKLIRMYYWECLTLNEIGVRSNLTRERIRQLLSSACRKLKVNAHKNYIYYGDKIYREYRNKRLEDEIKYKEAQLRILQNKLNTLNLRANASVDKIDIIDIESINREALIYTPVENFDISIRLYNLLKRNNINTFEDILKTPYNNYISMRSFGAKSLRELETLVYEKISLALTDRASIKEYLTNNGVEET